MRAGALARRMAAALERHPGRPALEALAREYALACQALNERLEKCAALLAAGSEHQALQVAESHPPVLDQVAELEFARIEEWRDLCAEEGLVQAEVLDVRTIRQLNAIYAKGLASTHALYKEYRGAMLKRNREAARAALERILELDPRDRNAEAELARLEGRAVPELERSGARSSIPKLSISLGVGRRERTGVERQEPEVEGEGAGNLQGFPAKRLSGPELKAKVEELLARMRAAREGGDAEAVQSEVARLKAVVGGRLALLTAEQSEERHQLETWAADEIRRRQAEEERRRRARDLEDRLIELEAWVEEEGERDEPVWQVALVRAGELREQGEGDWSRLGELEGRLTRVEERLRGGWERARARAAKRNRRLWMVGTVLVVLGAGVLFLNGRVLANQSRVQLALDRGAVSEARRELESMESASWLFVGPKLALRERMEGFRERLAEEEARAARVRGALAELGQEAARDFAGQPFRKVGRRFEECREEFAALAQEFRDELSASYGRVTEAWDRWVDREREASVARLNEVLAEVEGVVRARLDFRHDPGEAEKGLAEVKPMLAELADFQLPVMAGLRLPGETIERARQARVHAEAVESELKKLKEARDRMQTALSLGEYQAALEVVAGSQFLESEVVDEARRVARRGLSEGSFAASAMMPEAPKLWSFLREQGDRPLFPERPTERERSLFLALRDEVDLKDIYRCLVTPLAPGQRGAERTIFSRGQPQRRDSTISETVVRSEWLAEFYDPARHPSAIQFEAVPIGFSFVNRRPGDLRLVESTVSTESDLFRRLGLGEWIDRSSGEYRGPILRLLDQVRAEPLASPLFVSHVFLRLLEMTQERPEAWGVLLSPSLREVARDLRTTLSLEVLPSDWMVPRRRELHEARLKSILDGVRGRSFEREAEVLRAFYGAAAKEGFAFSGHVGLEGRVELSPRGGGALELWGLEAVSLRPSLLFRRPRVGEDWQQVRVPQPLTPLFAVGTDRRQLWRETVQRFGLALDDPSVQVMRPDFVQAEYGR
ncbi:MAG: hypothetical protein SNJ84_02645 [Verrucomicrobiia bacterium]